MAKKVKEVKAKKSARKSRAAFVLAFIAVVILLVNGLLVSFMSKKLSSLLALYTGNVINASAMLTYGIIWIVLAAFIWMTMHRIEKLQLKSEKWLLLALAVITFIAGRLESGVLVLISAIIYLRQK